MWPIDKINEAAINPGPSFPRYNKDDRMSLEHHIKVLSQKYGSFLDVKPGSRIFQSSKQQDNKKSGSANLLSEILQRENHNSQNKNSTSTKSKTRIANQKEESCDKVRITFSSSQINSDFFKEFSEIVKSGVLNGLGISFFQKLNQLISQKPVESCKTVIKLNNEPVFPLKTTVEYLCMLYEGTSIKVQKIDKKKLTQSQFSIDITLPKS